MNLVFILSTGRTGTLFFEDYINSTSSNAFCLHEPYPSRRFKFMSNMFLQGRLSDEFICRSYENCRQFFFNATCSKNIYVESNNFIFGCIPALNRRIENIKIIHIVREPYSYIQSHLNHGFWKGSKGIIALLAPYWLEDIGPKLKYRHHPEILLGLRWIYVNDAISKYEKSNAYLRVKFEDLFHGDINARKLHLEKVRLFLALKPIMTDDSLAHLQNRKNESRDIVGFDKNIVESEIGTKLHSELLRYGYL